MKYYIPFLICLISLSGYGQSKIRTGISTGYGIMTESRKEKIFIKGGLAFKYDLSSKFSINSGINLFSHGMLEVPLQLHYKFVSKDEISLTLFSGINIHYILAYKTHFNYFSERVENYKYKLTVYGSKVEKPLNFAVSSGVSIHFKKQLEFVLSYNYGLQNVILENIEQYIVDSPKDWEKHKESFFSDPEHNNKSSHFAISLIYWIPFKSTEKRKEIKSNNMENVNVLFIELFGTLIAPSINYDRIILSTNNSEENVRLAVRAGVNYEKNEKSSDINYLFGVSGLLGKNGHYFELGLGVQTPPEHGYIFGNHHFIGYRMQRSKIFLRGGLTLINYGREHFVPLPGLGIGIAF